MRYVLGILFMLFFVGFVACTFLLGGPPSQVYTLRDVILGGALVCVTLSTVALGMLVVQKMMQEINARLGVHTPIVCTPEELMEV